MSEQKTKPKEEISVVNPIKRNIIRRSRERGMSVHNPRRKNSDGGKTTQSRPRKGSVHNKLKRGDSFTQLRSRKRSSSIFKGKVVKFEKPEPFKIRRIHENPSKTFNILEILGEGAYGIINKVKSKKSGEVYAAKIIRIDPKELEDVEKEIRFITECNNKNIIKAYDAFKFENKLYILLELCEGGSLTEIINVLGRNLNEDEISLIAYDTINALTYLHDLNKIHRIFFFNNVVGDIKSGNILLTRGGKVKMADFGASAELSTKHGRKTNSVIGTPYWMAPEVVRKETYDAKADVWSLGITLIELGEGSPPLSDCNPMRAFFLIPKNPPPTFQEPDKWSDELNDFLHQCLQKNPNQRPSAKKLMLHRLFMKKVVTHRRRLEKKLADLVNDVFEVYRSVGGRQQYYKLQEEKMRKQWEEEERKALEGNFELDSDDEYDSEDWEEDSDDEDQIDLEAYTKSIAMTRTELNKGIKKNKDDDSDSDSDDYPEPPPVPNLVFSKEDLRFRKSNENLKIREAFAQLYCEIAERTEHLLEIEDVLCEKQINQRRFNHFLKVYETVPQSKKKIEKKKKMCQIM